MIFLEKILRQYNPNEYWLQESKTRQNNDLIFRRVQQKGLIIPYVCKKVKLTNEVFEQVKKSCILCKFWVKSSENWQILIPEDC